jgi:hypothetical protein
MHGRGKDGAWPGGEMTSTEEKVLVRGVAAGVIVGLASGLILAMFIVLRLAH